MRYNYWNYSKSVLGNAFAILLFAYTYLSRHSQMDPSCANNSTPHFSTLTSQNIL